MPKVAFKSNQLLGALFGLLVWHRSARGGGGAPRRGVALPATGGTGRTSRSLVGIWAEVHMSNVEGVWRVARRHLAVQGSALSL